MELIYDKTNLQTADDIIGFFKSAIEYRKFHKEESEKIACFVFDNTHETKIKIPLDEELEKIRYEFGALEAPGQPEDDMDEADYIDTLWSRLSSIIDKVNEKRTV